VPCYHASTIESQSDQFVNDLYASEWIDGNSEQRKMILMMMENLKKPLLLCAFGLDAINLAFFDGVSFDGDCVKFIFLILIKVLKNRKFK
jgi:hypothetical protein